MFKKKLPIFLIIFVIIAFGIYLYSNSSNNEINKLETLEETKTTPTTVIEESLLTDEQAEKVGFAFILNFIESAPPKADLQAQQKAYEALSTNAKKRVTGKSSGELARFVGVQDIPDLGASVEDLKIVSEKEATLIVGLNFSGGRVLKAIHLSAENGEWKVDRIEPAPSR